MEIKKVAFGRTINTGNYENIRYDLTADVSPDDNVFEVLNQLQELIEISHKAPKLSNELSRLEKQQETARSEARKLKQEIYVLQDELTALKKEKAKLRELFAACLEGSIPSENEAVEEGVEEAVEEGGDPDDIPFDLNRPFCPDNL